MDVSMEDAVTDGDLEAVRKWLNGGGKVDQVLSPSTGWAALHIAAFAANEPMVRLLLEYQPDLEAVDDTNATARHLAEETANRIRADDPLGMPERATEWERVAAIIKEAELRRKYDIPPRSNVEIDMGENAEGRFCTGFAWEGERTDGVRRQGNSR